MLRQLFPGDVSFVESEASTDLRMPITAGNENCWQVLGNVALRAPGAVSNVNMTTDVFVNEFQLEKWCIEEPFVEMPAIASGSSEMQQSEPAPIVPSMSHASLRAVDDSPDDHSQEVSLPQPVVSRPPVQFSAPVVPASDLSRSESDSDSSSYYDYSAYDYSVYDDSEYEESEESEDPSRREEEGNHEVDLEPRHEEIQQESPLPSINAEYVNHLFSQENAPIPEPAPEVGGVLENCSVEEEEEIESEKHFFYQHDSSSEDSAEEVKREESSPLTEKKVRVIFHGDEVEAVRNSVAEMAVNAGLQYVLSILEEEENPRDAIGMGKGGQTVDPVEMLPEDGSDAELRSDMFDMGCSKDEWTVFCNTLYCHFGLHREAMAVHSSFLLLAVLLEFFFLCASSESGMISSYSLESRRG